MDLDRKSTLLWVLATLWGVTIGAVVIFLGRRTVQQPLQGPPINIWNMTGGTAGSVPPSLQLAMPNFGAQTPMSMTLAANKTTAASVSPSKLETYTLSATNISRIATAASERHWQVQIRNIGPPGSFALVATDANSLNYPSMSITIPAGGFNEVRLKPREALFAIGNRDGVTLSVAISEELA